MPHIVIRSHVAPSAPSPRWAPWLAVVVFLGALTVQCQHSPQPAPVPESLLMRVERARGLHFSAPISLRRIRSRDVPSLIAAELELEHSHDDLARIAGAAIAMGLLPAGTDLRELLMRFSVDVVAGFYAPLQGHLYVVSDPGRSLSPPRTSDRILVHELAHALQDLHGDLIDVVLGLRDQDDLSFTLGAMIEGDALYTEYRDAYLRGDTLPPDAQKLSQRLSPATAAVRYPDIPRSVRELFILQYPLGYALVERLTNSGGAPSLDAALADPPLSSEQLLHPEKYTELGARDLPVFLSLPDDPLELGSGCEELRRTTMGELGLRIWLIEGLAASGQVREGSELASKAAEAAAGWSGDRSVVATCPSGSVFAWLIRFDDDLEARPLLELARRAADGLAERAGLAAPVTIEGEGADVLIAAGIPPAVRARILRGVREVRYSGLDAFLQAHPEVLERARSIRAPGQRGRDRRRDSPTDPHGG